MSIKLIELPYDLDGLEPHISKQTLSYHYGKHHKGYVESLNEALSNNSLADMDLDTLVRESEGEIYNDAAQVWNHNFYWQCLSPQGGGEPSVSLQKTLAASFGSWEAFRDDFTEQASQLFGSGWTWLVLAEGQLQIINMADAGNPLTENLKPLLTCDVWEHAYYLDRQNERGKYLVAFWQLVNWEFLEKQLAS